MSSLGCFLQCVLWSFFFHAAALGEASLSGTVEIDLIFPQNDTAYEPTDMMPFVFAIQNANLAATLDAHILLYTSNGNQTRGDTVRLDLNPANLTAPQNVYYAYLYLDIFNVEDTFAVNWVPFGKQCSGDIHYENDDAASHGQIFSFFTMRKGSLKPDFAGGHDANCSNTRSARFNITGTRPVYLGGQCAILSNSTPFPASGEPCAFKVDLAAASSITASLEADYTMTKCVAPHPTISCPANKSSAARLNGQSLSKAAMLLVAVGGWVAGVVAW